MNLKKTYAALLVWALALMIAGCASTRVVSDLDSAGHRVTNGYKFLDRGMLDEAEREFKAASDIESEYSPAYAGLAIVRADQGHYDLAAKLIDQARAYAKDPTAQAEVEVANIRVGTVEKQKGWIENAMTSFNRATALNPHSMAPYYFMGEAFKQSYNFKNAEEMFQKAAGSSNPYRARARSEALLMRAIIEYAPQSMAAKKAVLTDRIDRAELAALLVQEFDITQTVPAETESGSPVPQPPDIADHPYRKNIEAILKMRLPVLLTSSDKSFSPYEPVKRAELALITQDIIVRATGRNDLTTRYVGRYTPFSDVRSNSPYFNAAMLNVSLGIMDTGARDRREFDPLGPVSGADALRILHRMMDQIEQIKAEELRNT